MESINDLKRKMLELISAYSKRAYTAFRPNGDDLRLVLEEGMPIPYAGKVFNFDEKVIEDESKDNAKS